MFNRIFGKPKEHANANALATLDKLNETLDMLEKKERVLEQKAAAELERAKDFSKAKNKRGVQRTSLQEAGEMPSVEGSTPKPKMDMERFVPVEDDAMINARMALEMQDYSPPGPNHHHTPPGRH